MLDHERQTSTVKQENCKFGRVTDSSDLLQRKFPTSRHNVHRKHEQFMLKASNAYKTDYFITFFGRK